MSSGETPEPGAAAEPASPRRRRLALRRPTLAVALVVMLILGGTTVAFAVTQSLKIERPPVSAPRFDRLFSPACGCEQSSAALVVRFREAERVTVTVVDADGQHVRALAENQRVPRGDAAFAWDGRTDGGSVSPDGPYRLEFDLARAGRTVLLPTTIRIDTEPPEVSVLGASPETISPDRDDRAERVKIRYRTSERGTPVLRIAPGVEKEGKHRPVGRSALAWGGTIGGAPAAPGDYQLSLQVRDDAGNLSSPSDPIDVVVQYVSLNEERFEVVRGGVLEFEVTGAAPYSWQLIRRPRGDRPARSVVYVPSETDSRVAADLRPGIRPGRYVLRAWRGGHEDTAEVRIRRPS